MKRFILLLTLCGAALASAWSLEIKDGRIKLTVDERTGRFSLYYLADAVKGTYQSLLYDQESRTSYATLYMDQRAYKLGESSEFKVSVAKEGQTAVVSYRSSSCVVTLRFSVVASQSGLKDSLAVSYTLENVSERELSLGLRVLLDTWLGEKSGNHFSAQARGELSGETTLSGDYADQWIRSGQDASAQLQVTLVSPATKPDRVIAANWKRLNDSSWTMETSATRNFTLLPYSINDSALALYWDPQSLRKGSSRTVSMLLGNQASFPAMAASGAGSASAVADAAQVTQLSQAPLDMAADLVVLREVIAALDALLASGEDVDPEVLTRYLALLELLESRREGY